MAKKRICNVCRSKEFLELSTGWKCNECGKIQGRWAIRSIIGWVKEGKTKITQKDASIIRKIINKDKKISSTEEKDDNGEWVEIQRRTI